MSTPLEIAGSHKRTEVGNNDWYYGGGAEAWADMATALAGVPGPVRKGKTVGVYESGEIVEYWWRGNNVADGDIVEKLAASNTVITETHTGDFTLPYKAGQFILGIKAAPVADINLKIGTTPGGGEVLQELQVYAGDGEYIIINRELDSDFTLYFSGITSSTDFRIRIL